MCNPALIGAAVAAIGAGVSYAGQQKQAAEVKRARNEQAAHTAAQKQLAQQQQDEELKLSKEKQDAIVDEAEEVSPNKRVEQIEAETIKAQESNVNAMEDANLLGEDSISQAGEGNYSDAYIQKKALDEANQTDAAIGMARLFGASTATGRAMQNNKINQIQHQLKQSDIDGKRNSVRAGYNVLFNDLAARKAEKSSVGGSVGGAAQALGGAAMNYGLSTMGNSMGANAGKAQANKNIYDNLF